MCTYNLIYVTIQDNTRVSPTYTLPPYYLGILFQDTNNVIHCSNKNQTKMRANSARRKGVVGFTYVRKVMSHYKSYVGAIYRQQSVHGVYRYTPAERPTYASTYQHNSRKHVFFFVFHFQCLFFSSTTANTTSWLACFVRENGMFFFFLKTTLRFE